MPTVVNKVPALTGRHKGLIFTIVLSLGILLFFFGKLLLRPNNTYLSTGGDGFQSYYTALYHIRYDSLYTQQQCMNYPFRESIFFTGCEPVFSIPLKLLQAHTDCSQWLVGISNTAMLISIVLCSVFLCLILLHLQLPWWLAALGAVGITYLSPQMWRLTGHYNLTYQFAIPAFIYLLMRFYEAPSLKKSFVIAALLFLLASMHLYFLGFFCFLSVFYWAILFILRKERFKSLPFVALHGAIQILLPFIILQFLILSVHSVQDRTVAPWGFLVYRSSLGGIFFPQGKFYEPMLRKLFVPDYVEWEGVAYVGLSAIAGLVLLCGLQVKRCLKEKSLKPLLLLNDNLLLGIFFWASVAAAFYACGFPYRWDDRLLDMAGLLRQMRGIGRFNWIFFYVLNILSLYLFYRFAEHKKSWFRNSLLGLLLLGLYSDAYSNIKPLPELLNNQIPDLEDRDNLSAANAWLKQADLSGYQAILPLPFFQIGSEHLDVSPASHAIVLPTFVVSLKTGLPTLAMASSRASISQCLYNRQLELEPYRPLDIVKQLPNRKPLLVLARETELNQNERYLLAKCAPLFSSKDYKVYALSIDSLEHYTETFYRYLSQQYQADSASHHNSNLAVTCSYDTLEGAAFKGKGALSFSSKKYAVLYDSTLPPGDSSHSYVLSFWLNNITADLYPRTEVYLTCFDSTKSHYEQFYIFSGKALKVIDGTWGLIELPFQPASPKSRIRIVAINNDLKRGRHIEIDELMIRPGSLNIYSSLPAGIMKNNRYYYAPYFH